jgi:hypothetical protein
MIVQKLSQNAAFGAGSHLWIFADPKISAFSRVIDFYLNFQMAKAEKLDRKSLPQRLIEILKSNQLDELTTLPEYRNHWLISTRRKLPCYQVVVIPFGNSKQQWVQEAVQVWQNLKNPSLRLFLPPPIAHIDLNQLLPKEMLASTTYVAGDLQLDA